MKSLWLLIGLNICDLFLSLCAFKNGATELNPLFSNNAYLFATQKMGLMVLIYCVALYLYKKKWDGLSFVLLVGNVIYGFVLLWHLVGFMMLNLSK